MLTRTKLTQTSCRTWACSRSKSCRSSSSRRCRRSSRCSWCTCGTLPVVGALLTSCAHKSECQQKAIKLTLRKGESIRALDAERIIADPGRLNQCLINFVTNGVKCVLCSTHRRARADPLHVLPRRYTTESQRRAITIHLDAFTSPPPQPEQAMRVSNKTAAIEGPPEPDTIWIQVGVEDSGKGLTQDELKKLFARFSQANPKYVGHLLPCSTWRLLTTILRSQVGPVRWLGTGPLRLEEARRATPRLHRSRVGSRSRKHIPLHHPRQPRIVLWRPGRLAGFAPYPRGGRGAAGQVVQAGQQYWSIGVHRSYYACCDTSSRRRSQRGGSFACARHRGAPRFPPMPSCGY